MKATELRLGNLIYNTKGEVDVVNLEALKYLIDYPDPLCQAKPIPLTEEWLLKFGFKLQYGFGGRKKYYKDRYLIEDGISIFFDNGLSFKITSDAQNSTHASLVKYVHQLQNLYFALTGTELEITK